MSVQILRDIQDSEVAKIVKDFESKGCTVDTQKQPNGNWTVQAICPERAAAKKFD
jgi:hypothetical protein